MKHFICQQEETCSGCQKEIQRGEWAYFNDYEDRVYCEDCADFEEETN